MIRASAATRLSSSGSIRRVQLDGQDLVAVPARCGRREKKCMHGDSLGFLLVSKRFSLREHDQNLLKFDPNQARKSGEIH